MKIFLIKLTYTTLQKILKNVPGVYSGPAIRSGVYYVPQFVLLLFLITVPSPRKYYLCILVMGKDSGFVDDRASGFLGSENL